MKKSIKKLTVKTIKNTKNIKGGSNRVGGKGRDDIYSFR